MRAETAVAEIQTGELAVVLEDQQLPQAMAEIPLRLLIRFPLYMGALEVGAAVEATQLRGRLVAMAAR